MAKSFKSMTEPEPNTVMLVDSLNFAFRWRIGKGHKLLGEYLDTINSLKRSYKASHVIVLADWGGSSYRLGLSSDYKANRAEARDNQSEKDKEDFEFMFSEYKAALEQIKDETDYPVLQYKGVEADDIAAYIVQSLKKKPTKVWIISTDRDLDQLVSSKVSRFSYVTRKETTLDNWNEIHEGYTPEDFISIKVLTGDKGDNVAGIPRVGVKTAARIVKQYGTAIDLAESLPITSHLKIYEAINKSRDLIYLNYKLMDLECYCGEAIGQDNMLDIDNRLSDYLG